MDAKTLYNEVKSILENDATLKGYVKDVYAGVRKSIPDAGFPCIILEPKRRVESNVVYDTQDNVLELSILAYTFVRDEELQIVGDSNYKGILDFENDILKALCAYPTLSGKCTQFLFTNSAYDVESYPIRGVIIDLQINYRQDFTART